MYLSDEIVAISMQSRFAIGIREKSRWRMTQRRATAVIYFRSLYKARKRTQ